MKRVLWAAGRFSSDKVIEMHGITPFSAVRACGRVGRTVRMASGHSVLLRWVALCICTAAPLSLQGAESSIVGRGSVPVRSGSRNTSRTGPQPLLQRAPEPPPQAGDAICPGCQRLERPKYVVPEAVNPRFGRDKPGKQAQIRGASTVDSAGPLPTGPVPAAQAAGDLRVWRGTHVNPTFPASPPGLPVPGHSTTNEPSFGVNQDVIFTTGNWYAALSTDLGVNWQFMNPYDNFPADGTYDTPANGWFCCDQIVYYERSRDLMCWVLQYNRTNTTGNTIQNLQRIAWATSRQDLVNNNWGFVDLDPTDYGMAANTFWLDFPDLQVTSNNLCLTTNVFRLDGTSLNRAVFMTVPLDTLKNNGPFNYSYSVHTVNSIRMCNGCTDTMYFATHIDSDTMRIHRWPEGSPNVPFEDVDHTAFNSVTAGPMMAAGPDGTNWAGFSDNRVLGAYRAGGEIGFMYGSRQSPADGLPFPYVDVARFRESDRAHLFTDAIYSTQCGILYPAVQVNARGDRGGVLAFGGGTFHPSVGVYVVDEFNGFSFDQVSIQTVGTGNAGPAGNRWGDYLTARQSWLDPYTWHAAGYILTSSTTVFPLNVWFSRERDTPPAEIAVTDLIIDGGRCQQVGATPTITTNLFNLGMTGITVPLVQFRLSTDANVDFNDLLLGEATNTVVNASESVQVSITPAIPNVATGQYYLGVTTPFLADELPYNNSRVYPQTLGIDTAPGPAPVITAPMAEYTCEPDGLLVDVSVRSALPITQYTWTKNGAAYSSPDPAGDPDLRIVSTMPGDSGFYQLSALSDCGFTTTPNIIVAVGVWFRQHPVSASINPCGTATFSVEAYGYGPLNYQWQRDGVNLANDGRTTGVNAASLTITAARYEDEGAYRCLVSNVCGTFASNSAKLTLPTPVWVRRSTTGPRQRAFISSDVAYDALRHVAVVYGGYSVNVGGTVEDLNDTWEWDGIEWTQRFPAHNPDRRRFQRMVFDTSRNLVLLFGGSSAYVPPNNEVWGYDGNDWALLSANSPSGPSPSVWVQYAVFDSARAKMILITGPLPHSPYQNATWEFDSLTLTWSLATSGTPIGYWGSAFAYDSVRHVTVGQNYLIGQFQSYAATWTFNGASWTNAGVVTPPRDSSCMAFDTTRRRTVLYSGGRGGGVGYYSTDTWAFDGAAWQQLFPDLQTTQYDAVLPLALAYDTSRRAMIMVGQNYNGSSGDIPVQTWEYRYLDHIVFDKQPQGQPLTPGGTASFTVYAAGYGTLSYQWKRNGQNIANGPAPGGGTFAGATTLTLTLTGVQAADDAAYACLVSNACGSALSNAALLGTLPMDFDGDNDVDNADVAAFEACAGGAAVPVAPPCQAKDLDSDGDVDQSDFGVLQRCFAGADVPPNPNCMN